MKNLIRVFILNSNWLVYFFTMLIVFIPLFWGFQELIGIDNLQITWYVCCILFGWFIGPLNYEYNKILKEIL